MEHIALHFTTDVGEENLRFVPRPPKQVKGLEREALHAIQHLYEVHHARLLQRGVLGPGAHGDLEHLLADVGKAGLLGVRSELATRYPRAVDGGKAVEEHLVPLVEVMLLRESPVVGGVLDIKVLELDPAAGIQVSGGRRLASPRLVMSNFGSDILVYPFSQLVPVVEGTGHVAADDEVELEWVSPLLLDVVDLELEVRWNPLQRQ